MYTQWPMTGTRAVKRIQCRLWTPVPVRQITRQGGNCLGAGGAACKTNDFPGDELNACNLNYSELFQLRLGSIFPPLIKTAIGKSQCDDRRVACDGDRNLPRHHCAFALR